MTCYKLFFKFQSMALQLKVMHAPTLSNQPCRLGTGPRRGETYHSQEVRLRRQQQLHKFKLHKFRLRMLQFKLMKMSRWNPSKQRFRQQQQPFGNKVQVLSVPVVKSYNGSMGEAVSMMNA